MLNAANILKSKDIRPSVQRVKVLHYLLQKKNHPTVDTIYQELLPEMPSLSRTTVYNTLDTLCEHGLAMRLDMGEGYERYDADTSGHSHFLCKKCGKVYDLWLTASELSKGMPTGFKLEESMLYAFGICVSCKDNP